MKIATVLKVAKVGLRVAKPVWETATKAAKKVIKKKPVKKVVKKAVKAKGKKWLKKK
tara:strand:+ start:1595 stop:1765 length:171 start_codon:yes stop_codon:yes gene_type:complete